MSLLNRPTLQEHDVHQLLSSPRRREALAYLWNTPGSITLRDLSEALATVESGESPAPRPVRESVYISLHQTHLPRLHDLGVVEYDRDRKEITLLENARDLTRYMDLEAGYGFTWAGIYRGMGIAGLCGVVAALANVPGFVLIDPLLWASGTLLAFAATTAYQLVRHRHAIRRLFF